MIDFLDFLDSGTGLDLKRLTVTEKLMVCKGFLHLAKPFDIMWNKLGNASY